MTLFLTVLHVVVSFFLIIVVLLQSGKAADLAGAFGGMGSQTAFGPRGAATLLSKATTTSAVLFMLTSISLGIWGGTSIGTGESVIERSGAASEESPPAAPLVPDVNIETIPIAPAGLDASADVEVTGSGPESGSSGSSQENPQ